MQYSINNFIFTCWDHSCLVFALISLKHRDESLTLPCVLVVRYETKIEIKVLSPQLLWVPSCPYLLAQQGSSQVFTWGILLQL